MRVTLFAALLLTVACGSQSLQLAPPALDASAAVPQDAAPEDGSAVVVADLLMSVDADETDLMSVMPDIVSAPDMTDAVDADEPTPGDLATQTVDMSISCPSMKQPCGRLCCSFCCQWVPCPPLSTCPDGSYNDELAMVIVGVCC